LWPLANPAEAQTLVESALGDADGSLRGALHVARAVQLAVAACPQESLEVLSGIDRSTLDGISGVYLGWAAAIALGDMGRVEDARTISEHCYALSTSHAEAAYQGVGLTEFAVIALMLGGHISDSVAVAERTLTRCVDVPGIPRSVATAIMGLANLGAGNLPAACEQLSTATTDFERYGDTSGLVYNFVLVLTEVLARSGRVEEARVALRRMTAARHPSFAFIDSDALLARAWVEAAAGRIGQARQLATRAADFAGEHGQWAREVWCRQTAAGFGDTGMAVRLAELTAIVEGPRAAVATRYAAAIAARDARDLAAVSEEFEVFGDRLAAAETAAQAAAMFTASGRRGSALTASARADRLAAECGAALRPDLRTGTRQTRLSRREREIAVLLGQGLSNKAIADALTMSVRTVEGHIYRVSTRLGLSRVQLAETVAEQSVGGDR
jgi:DNA-binding CsgD family transcriptional regulator